MGEERQRYGVKILMVGLLVLLASAFAPSKSHAQVIVADPAPGYGISQVFRMRTATRPHMGNDILTPCSTRLTTQAPISCPPPTSGGYGQLGIVNLACDVTLRYGHLYECQTGQTSVITGGGAGMVGAGNSEGCHLHFEVRIGGAPVDPQRAYGQDLCNATVRQELLAHAQSVLGSYAGGGGGSTSTGGTTGSGTSTTPAPPPTGVVSSVYVPGGTIINPGPGYYLVTHVNGRVEQVVALSSDGWDGSSMPPTTEDVVPSTNSTSNPVTGCAADTWSAMVNQAVLQTRREMAINQRYVVKPDSVMAYSCLSEQMMLVGQNAGLLSESQIWANREVDILNGETVTVTVDMGRNSLDGAINNVAREPYQFFLQSYFNYDFLGGQAPGLTGSAADDEEHGLSQSSASCGVMARVWQVAKCMNVTDDPMFPRFEELIATDPRQYPENYACNDTGITQNMINIAQGSEVDLDPITTYLPMLYPGSCNPPIATGITVERQDGVGQITSTIRHADGLCITAGCSYQNTGGGGAGRCEIRTP